MDLRDQKILETRATKRDMAELAEAHHNLASAQEKASQIVRAAVADMRECEDRLLKRYLADYERVQ